MPPRRKSKKADADNDAASSRSTPPPSILPWQWGQLGLTEDGGNRLIKYADALVEGVRGPDPPVPSMAKLIKAKFSSFSSPLADAQASPNDGTCPRDPHLDPDRALCPPASKIGLIMFCRV